MRFRFKLMSRSRRTKSLLIISIIIIIITIICYKINDDLRPVLIAYCDYEARTLAVRTINKTILEEFASNISYEDLMKVSTDSEGKIVMLQADTIKLNKLSSQIAIDVQENIQDISSKGINTYVPLGVVLKNDFFAYMGPKIKFKMEPAGTAYTEYRSQFESAGINQTRHIIYIDVTIDIYVVIPLYRNSITVSSSIPIAESIIVGDVPNTYMNGFPYINITPTPTPVP
jgi:sporulation protein YunB